MRSGTVVPVHRPDSLHGGHGFLQPAEAEDLDGAFSLQEHPCTVIGEME
jgi:hypothetical protein